METASRITSALSRWIDEVAELVLAGIEHMRAAPHARFVEQKDGRFVADALPQPYSEDEAQPAFQLVPEAPTIADDNRLKALIEDARVEIVLRQDRFLFRPLELPSRAGEFLDGIVRTQIDRLTPWSAANAVFGWSAPIETGGGRMTIMVATTGRKMLEPLTELLSGLGAASIRFCVMSPDPGEPPIVVSDQKTRAAREIGTARRVLLSALLGLGGLAAVSILALIVVGSDLGARKTEIDGRIDAIRASAHARHDPSSEPVAALQRRKYDTPSSVLVLDALAATLPDHTYLTELRVQDGKVQIIGMTKDAPSLIALLEQAPQFSEASFLAPTTRSLAKPGDNFQIEAGIRPPRHVKP